MFRAMGGRRGSPGGESQSIMADFRLFVSSDLAPEAPFCSSSRKLEWLGGDDIDNSSDLLALPLIVACLCPPSSGVLPTQEPF